MTRKEKARIEQGRPLRSGAPWEVRVSALRSDDRRQELPNLLCLDNQIEACFPDWGTVTRTLLKPRTGLWSAPFPISRQVPSPHTPQQGPGRRANWWGISCLPALRRPAGLPCPLRLEAQIGFSPTDSSNPRPTQRQSPIIPGRNPGNLALRLLSLSLRKFSSADLEGPIQLAPKDCAHGMGYYYGPSWLLTNLDWHNTVAC